MLKRKVFEQDLDRFERQCRTLNMATIGEICVNTARVNPDVLSSEPFLIVLEGLAEVAGFPKETTVEQETPPVAI